MAVRNKSRELRTATPVTMFWQFNDDTDIVPRISANSASVTATVLDAYGADSVEDLADTLTPNAHSPDELRLGVVTGTTDDPSFYTETELMERVEGVTSELAAGLVDWCNDIPTLCERRRRSGDVFLGDLRHDAQVEDREWVDDLEALIDDFEFEDNLEARMKNAGVWVEPQNAVADW